MKRLLTRLLSLLLAGTSLLLCACGDAYDAGSPQAVVKTLIEAIASCDVEGELACYPDFKIAYLMDWYEVDSEAQLIQAMKDVINENDKLTRRSCTNLKAEVTEDAADADERASILNALKDRYNLTEEQLEKVTEFCVVKVTYKLDGKKKSDSIRCIKYDGRWYAPY